MLVQQVKVLRDFGDGRQIVRQQVVDVPVERYQPNVLYLAYPIVPVGRRRAAQQHKPKPPVPMLGRCCDDVIIASQYRHSAGPGFIGKKYRKRLKTPKEINQEQRARRHHKYKVVDYE